MKKVKTFIARKIIAAKSAIKRKSAVSSAKNLLLFSVQTPQDYNNYVKEIELLDNYLPAYDVIVLTTDAMAPDFLFHPARKIISTKELNYFELPKKEISNQFRNSDFNYLINTCITDCFALDYLATIINAKLKISIYKPEKLKIYDLLLNPETDIKQKSFIELTLKYLEKIKN